LEIEKCGNISQRLITPFLKSIRMSVKVETNLNERKIKVITLKEKITDKRRRISKEGGNQPVIVLFGD